MHAEAILRSDFKTEFEEVLSVLEATMVPLRIPTQYAPVQRGGPLKRQKKSLAKRSGFLLLPIEQGALNKALDTALRGLGWAQQPFVDELRKDRKLSSALKGDFAKNQVFMEVEFGNTASMFRDLFKFHMAGRTGDAEVGILVAAKQAMATFFDSGVTTFEAAQRLLPYLHIGVQIPICLIGLEPDDWQPIQDAYEDMQHLCEANGETCHDFATAWKYSGFEEPEPERAVDLLGSD